MMDSVVFKTKHDYSLSYSSYASPYVITESFGEMLKKVRIEQRGELFRYAWRSLHEEDLLPTSRKRNVISLYCVAGNENSDAGMLLAAAYREFWRRTRFCMMVLKKKRY